MDDAWSSVSLCQAGRCMLEPQPSHALDTKSPSDRAAVSVSHGPDRIGASGHSVHAERGRREQRSAEVREHFHEA
eukprot:CAMPEP_0117003160 /NCGR_PEP_ID=MMETSP0472-20121206/4564_1 /TAXON_ID=693140 ORGANISM="Tiarina fusus, Strain LIS" /NCGR_SAMPLE_ID=MMETSP0472 /ASSEMBLY_ACC=CAM_ASM_000603 /LENGTH=74 /DNA_ID=CAMNT_0004703699 /DNA_START=435 /DNA_END=656 /DNA_ORIENTATION=+